MGPGLWGRHGLSPESLTRRYKRTWSVTRGRFFVSWGDFDGGHCGCRALNRCWCVSRVVAVNRRCGLSMNAREAEAVPPVLASCPSFALEIVAAAEAESAAVEEVTPMVGGDIGVQSGPHPVGHPLDLYDDNGNGRIHVRRG